MKNDLIAHTIKKLVIRYEELDILCDAIIAETTAENEEERWNEMVPIMDEMGEIADALETALVRIGIDSKTAKAMILVNANRQNLLDLCKKLA